MFNKVCACLLGFSLLLPIQAVGAFRLDSGETISDPTQPGDWRVQNSVRAITRNYKLNYILNADGRKLAMINGQKVGEGDMVSGARVLRIREGEVSVLVDGQRRTLTLGTGKGVKKSAQ